MECIICLNDLSTNDFYNLTCCNNDIHIHCLHNWINSNITNKNISKCFICSQDNDIIRDITSFNYNRQIVIHLDNDYNDSLLLDNESNHSHINNHSRNNLIIFLEFLCFFIIIYYLLFC